MSPYQVMSIIALCTVVFAGVVTILTMLGAPLLVAFLGVYLVAIWVMLGMQRRARESFDGNQHAYQRRYDAPRGRHTMPAEIMLPDTSVAANQTSHESRNTQTGAQPV